MSQHSHARTLSDKALRELPLDDLEDRMARCDVDPGEPEVCDDCAAYREVVRREEEAKRPTKLIDSLAADVQVGFDSQGADCGGMDIPIAEAILRSPEMQQIKLALFRFANMPGQGSSTPPKLMLRRVGLSPHVIEWVLG